MQRSILAVALALATMPFAAVSTAQAQKHEITLHGCVMPGETRDTYCMSNVMEVPGPGGSTMPEVAHGRRVLYWLRNDGDVRKHMNRMVEVRGEFAKLEKSEIELKTGRQKDGGLLVEFEGPGKDVLAPNATVGAAIGTAGRTAPEKDDVPTYLAHVNVRSVRVMSGECK